MAKSAQLVLVFQYCPQLNVCSIRDQGKLLVSVTPFPKRRWKSHEVYMGIFSHALLYSRFAMTFV